VQALLTAPYVVRQQRVRCGGGTRDVLVAVFPLESGRAACLQLQDHGELRRGGVYLAPTADAASEALAPRFDELFADAAGKAAGGPEDRRALRALLERARDVARSCVPRLTPEALQDLRDVAAQARARDGSPAADGFAWEELVVCSLLIFVSEEERYPRPRYRGGDVALERFLDVL
jgi:hypothetical protein